VSPFDLSRGKEAHTVPSVGFNPFRPQANRRSDIAILAIALIVVALAVLWAAMPR
jgi:hypothetical protein